MQYVGRSLHVVLGCDQLYTQATSTSITSCIDVKAVHNRLAGVLTMGYVFR